MFSNKMFYQNANKILYTKTINETPDIVSIISPIADTEYWQNWMKCIFYRICRVQLKEI